MIKENDGIFRIGTNDTSYWFRVSKYGHLEHIYYGARLSEQDISPLLLKHTAVVGSSIAYTKEDDLYSLDTMCLEWSGIGRGDFRFSPCEIKMPDKTFVCDFVYKNHQIIRSTVKSDALPTSYDEAETEACQSLIIKMEDESNSVWLKLIYTVFEKENIITRRVILENKNDTSLTIRRLLSMLVDLPEETNKLITFDGGWIKEAHKHTRSLTYGQYINSSTTGGSSNRHNPGFLLAENNTCEEYGKVYGFNLIYSGNHFSCVELSNQNIIRVALGINPHCFEWTLEKGESFETPEAVMTYSDKGFNGLSHNFHDFINKHIVRGEWKNRERPVLYNNWEATFFKFNQSKLLRLAKQAKKLGVELFVLDDGWFGSRNTDSSGLGDYTVNRKKLPSGLKGFASKINRLGMQFGLWFEPEMVNEDSELYRAHPEYAVKLPGKASTLGRHQLVLDLCKAEVRDYIVEAVGGVLDSANISYVKWDYNRHISEMYSSLLTSQGEFFHRYVLGLYDILRRIFYSRPHILLESCSSGGNRFDLGMLCFSPQIWSSDDTDPIERLKIQGGLSYLYPLSTMGAHISESPHQQTLRQTPISTRFNVASYGCLGYELDLKYVSRIQRKEIKEQIEFYKNHRKIFQYGKFSRIERQKPYQVQWQCVSEDKCSAISGLFQTLGAASDGHDCLKALDLEENSKYKLQTKPQRIYIKQFGGLVKHLLPISLDPEGFILKTVNKFHALTDCIEEYEGEGKLFSHGILLNNMFIGSYYNSNIRMISDFGSNLYIIKKTS